MKINDIKKLNKQQHFDIKEEDLSFVNLKYDIDDFFLGVNTEPKDNIALSYYKNFSDYTHLINISQSRKIFLSNPKKFKMNTFGKCINLNLVEPMLIEYLNNEIQEERFIEVYAFSIKDKKTYVEAFCHKRDSTRTFSPTKITKIIDQKGNQYSIKEEIYKFIENQLINNLIDLEENKKIVKQYL